MKYNPENYKWGFIYFDRSDNSVIVPKRNKWMGWTFNFASPYTYIIIIAFIAMMIYFSS